jgi:hypothetical protein
MKRKIVLLAAASLASLGLVSCNSTENSTGTGSESQVQAVATTFQEQLTNAGLKVTYVDPNPDFTKTEGAVAGYPDATTGGSNAPLYTAASISSFPELLYRSSLKYVEYYWNKTDGTTGVKTLADAAKLDDAKYMTALFPNDGNFYEIKSFKNAIGTKTFATADATGNVNMAVFGAAISSETVGETTTYFVNATYLTSGITTTNLLNTGKGELLYYEYNYASNDKMGPGTRNYGCRVDFTVDFSNTSITKADKSKVTITEKGNAPAYTEYAYLTTRLVLTNLKTLG